MIPEPTTDIPWRDRAFVTPAEAAVILARTPGWVRSRIVEGRLDGRQLTAGGPMLITVESLQRLITGAAPLSDTYRMSLRRQVARERPDAPSLRLVVSNDL